MKQVHFPLPWAKWSAPCIQSTSIFLAPGAAIEILIIDFSSKWTVDSASLQLYPACKAPNLLWVMHVTRISGVAERKGVGQIPESALEDALYQKPCGKRVLLG